MLLCLLDRNKCNGDSLRVYYDTFADNSYKETGVIHSFIYSYQARFYNESNKVVIMVMYLLKTLFFSILSCYHLDTDAICIREREVTLKYLPSARVNNAREVIQRETTVVGITKCLNLKLAAISDRNEESNVYPYGLCEILSILDVYAL